MDFKLEAAAELLIEKLMLPQHYVLASGRKTDKVCSGGAGNLEREL